MRDLLPLPDARGVQKRDRGLRAATAVRSATMPRRDPLTPLPPPAPRTRPVQVGRAHGGRGRARDRRAATPGRDPGRSSARSTGTEPRAARCGKAGSFPKSAGVRSSFVPRRFCAGTGHSSREVDEAASPARAPRDRSGGLQADPSDGKREPPVGIHEDQRRAGKAGDPRVRDERRDASSPLRRRASGISATRPTRASPRGARCACHSTSP